MAWVRITASVVMAHYVLPEILAGIHRAESGIELELHASDASENLLFHEADIAVRMYRPVQLDIITKHIGDMAIGLYAAKSYLGRHGTPTTREELMEHEWIGYDRNEVIIKGMRELGYQVDRSFFRTRCDNQAAYWHLLQAGWRNWRRPGQHRQTISAGAARATQARDSSDNPCGLPLLKLCVTPLESAGSTIYSPKGSLGPQHSADLL